jgi:hypothetical protein
MMSSLLLTLRQGATLRDEAPDALTRQPHDVATVQRTLAQLAERCAGLESHQLTLVLEDAAAATLAVVKQIHQTTPITRIFLRAELTSAAPSAALKSLVHITPNSSLLITILPTTSDLQLSTWMTQGKLESQNLTLAPNSNSHVRSHRSSRR